MSFINPPPSLFYWALQWGAGWVAICKLPSLWLVSIKWIVLLTVEPVWLVCPGYKWCLVSPAGYRHCRLLITGENPPRITKKHDGYSYDPYGRPHLSTEASHAVALYSGDERWRLFSSAGRGDLKSGCSASRGNPSSSSPCWQSHVHISFAQLKNHPTNWWIQWPTLHLTV